MHKVLIVDDDKEISDLITIILAIHKFRSYNATNPIDAFKIVHSFSPDIILMDIMLGGHDGRKLCKEIKQTHKHIPILLMSANPELLEDHGACEACGTIEKPFGVAALITKIKNALI